MNDQKNESAQEESWDKEFPGKTGLGSLLRKYREKKGLEIAQISEMTRLRPRYLKALEREDWDSLPAPVFVSGFIRAFARTVGLDEHEALALYQDTSPPEPEMPVSLNEPKKTKRVSMAVPIVILVLLGAALLLWMIYPGVNKWWTNRVEETSTPTSGESSTQPPVSGQEEASPSETRIQAEKEETPTGQTDATGIQESVLSEESPSVAPESPPAPVASTEAEPSAAPAGSGPEEAPFSGIQEVQAALEATDEEEYVLKAEISERSWIQIFVDDEPPKEYIFPPGSQAQWKAKKGFELVIGNAGGVSLQFNDRMMANLGDSGKVVRLSLPEEYKRITESE